MFRSGFMRITMVLIVAILLCCVGGWAWGVPRFQKELKDGISESIATKIATEVPAVPANGGQLRYSLGSLQNSIDSEGSNSGRGIDLRGATLKADGETIVIASDDSNDSFEYRFTPRVTDDGKLAFDSSSSTSGFGGSLISKMLPADVVGDSISRGVNQYLDAKHLKLTGVHLENNELVLDTAAR